MPKITDQELSLLRTRPHRSELKLWFYRPSTILAAQVNDVNIVRYAASITFGNVTSGSYANVKEGMTMYVGTAAGKADLGRVRVRSATATVLTVARNSIVWANAVYLTVVDFYEIWPRYIREVQNGTTTIHYKDYDIAYSNQNNRLGTLMAVGSHAVVNAGDSLYWSSSGTVQTEGSSLSWQWSFGGGATASSTSPDPGWVQYLTPGYYTTQVTASGPTGTYLPDTTYRHVIVAGGSIQPYSQFGFDSLDGSRDQGGWVAKVWLKEDNLPEVVEGTLVIVTADNWYGTTKQNIGGGRSNILFVGYIIDNSITYDYMNSRMEFSVSSPTGRMKLEDNSSMEIDSVVSPTNWYEIHELNGKKTLYHYLRWHSTLLNCCDVRWTAEDRAFKTVQGEIATLYDVVNNIMLKYSIGEVVSDRQATVWLEKHPMSVHAPTGTYNTVLDMDRRDWMNEISFDESFINQISYLEMGGLSYAGAATGTWHDYLSGAPGDNLKGYFGKSELIQGQYVLDQNENNVLVGDVYAYKNSLFPTVNIDIAGWYSLFDIAPEEIVNLTLNPSDTNRGIVWNKKPFLLRDMSIDHKSNVFSLLPKITLHEVTQGVAGETVPIVNPPVPNWPEPPPWQPPDWPIIPPITPYPWIPPIIPKPPVDVPVCWGDDSAAPNGPFDTGMHGTIYDTGPDNTLYGSIHVSLRSLNAANKSQYQFLGKFQERNVDEDGWRDTTDTSFYKVWASQTKYGYQHVIEGTRPPASDGDTRWGFFLPPAPINIDMIELSMNNPSAFYLTSGTPYGDGAPFYGLSKRGDVTYDDWGIITGDGGGNWFYRNVGFSAEYWPDPHFYDYPDRFYIYPTGMTMWFPPNSTDGTPIVHTIDVRSSDQDMIGGAIWIDYVNASGPLHIYEHLFSGPTRHVTINPEIMAPDDALHGYTRTITVGCNFPYNGPWSNVISIKAGFGYHPTHRIIINKAFLWNVCDYNLNA